MEHEERLLHPGQGLRQKKKKRKSVLTSIIFLNLEWLEVNQEEWGPTYEYTKRALKKWQVAQHTKGLDKLDQHEYLN